MYATAIDSEAEQAEAGNSTTEPLTQKQSKVVASKWLNCLSKSVYE